MRLRLAGVLLAAAAAAYTVAAWINPPGFYDGFCAPAASYNWLVPPAGQRPTAQPGSVTVSANNNRGPYFAATADASGPQAQLSWVPDGFDTDSNATVTIGIKPTTQCGTPPPGAEFTTNVYDLTASAKLVKQASLHLLLAPNMPSATLIYHSPDSGCSWSTITATTPGTCGDIYVRINELGLYAAGVANISGHASGRGAAGVQSLLPWIVAGAIVVVILAGLPLALVRRQPPRRGGGKANPDPSSRRRRPRRRT